MTQNQRGVRGIRSKTKTWNYQMVPEISAGVYRTLQNWCWLLFAWPRFPDLCGRYISLHTLRTAVYVRSTVTWYSNNREIEMFALVGGVSEYLSGKLVELLRWSRAIRKRGRMTFTQFLSPLSPKYPNADRGRSYACTSRLRKWAS